MRPWQWLAIAGAALAVLYLRSQQQVPTPAVAPDPASAAPPPPTYTPPPLWSYATGAPPTAIKQPTISGDTAPTKLQFIGSPAPSLSLWLSSVTAPTTAPADVPVSPNFPPSTADPALPFGPQLIKHGGLF